MSLGIVDMEGDEILSLDTSAVLVVNSYILPLKAQLEQTALRDRDLHLSMFTGHLCLDNVILTYITRTRCSVLSFKRFLNISYQFIM